MNRIFPWIRVRHRTQLQVLAAMMLMIAGCGTASEQSSRKTGASTDSTATNDDTASVEEPDTQAAVPAETTPKMESKQVVVDVSAFLEDALNGRIDEVRKALESGFDVNAADEQQRTALLFAAFNGHTAVAKLLLDQNASLEHRDAAGRTALMFAASGPNAETVELLAEAGAEVNAVDTDEKFTALMHAAAEGQVKVVEVLLKHNADPAIQDADGDTARDFATNNGHAEVVRLLSK
jgi:ankyrin repeat protein